MQTGTKRNSLECNKETQLLNGLRRHYFSRLLFTNSLDYLCLSLTFRQNIPSSFVPTYTKSLRLMGAPRDSKTLIKGREKHTVLVLQNIITLQVSLAQESWTVEMIHSWPVMVAEFKLESIYRLGNQFSMALSSSLGVPFELRTTNYWVQTWGLASLNWMSFWFSLNVYTQYCCCRYVPASYLCVTI